jgi:hypothetical protein
MKKILIENTTLDELVNELNNIVNKAIHQKQEPINVNENTILTREETKKLLKVSYVTLHKWNKLGVLPAFNVGNRVYYKLDDIHKAMKPIYCD